MLMSPKFHTRDTLDDYVITAIGLVAAEWSLCETYVAVAIWKMLGVTWEQGHIITDDLSPIARIKMFHAIAADKFETTDPTDPDIFAEATALFSRLSTCNTERNNLIHHVWSAKGVADFHTQKYSARSGKFKITPLNKTGFEIMKLVQEIQILADDVDEFHKTHLDALPPSPTKS